MRTKRIKAILRGEMISPTLDELKILSEQSRWVQRGRYLYPPCYWEDVRWGWLEQINKLNVFRHRRGEAKA